MAQLALAQVVVEESLGGSYPECIIIFASQIDVGTRHQTLAAKDAIPRQVVKVQTVQAVVGSHIEPVAVGRQRQLGDEVVRESFPCGILRAELSDGSVLGEHQQSVAHHACPSPSFAVFGVVGDAEEIELRDFHRVILCGLRVDPSAALTVGTQPDAPVVALADGQHGRGYIVGKVPDETAFLVQAIDTVFVGAEPGVVLAIYKDTADVGGAYHVLGSRLVPHIVEARRGGRLLEYAFLRQT